MTLTSLTEPQRRVLKVLALLDVPLARDGLMDRVGSFVSGVALRGLERSGLLVSTASTDGTPPTWAITPAGRAHYLQLEAMQ